MVVAVNRHHLAKVWGQVEPHIDAALQRLPISLADASDVAEEIATLKASLYVAIDDDGKIHGAMVMDCVQHPKAKVARVKYIGGKNIALWKDNLLAAAEHFKKSNECSLLVGFGRKGLVRLFGGKIISHEIVVGNYA